MKKIKEVLRRFGDSTNVENKSSVRNMAQATGISRPTVAAYLKRFKESGMSLEEALALPDEVLLSRLTSHASSPNRRVEELYRHFETKASDLGKKGVTRLLLWEEYRATVESRYGYTQYCEHLKRWTASTPELRCLIDHEPGEELFVDYSGKRVPYIRLSDGAALEAEVFVAILGSSQMTFAIALLSQKQEDTVRGCVTALEYFDGTTTVIVPDCMKTAVVQADRYEPILNNAFKRFAEHYGMTVVPARAMKPRDKALVENAVQNIQRCILAPLRDRRFENVDEINAAFSGLLEAYNDRKFQKINRSRRDLFLEVEKATLRHLPSFPYEHRIVSRQTVPNTYHVIVREDGHLYSVPCRYAGRRVRVETSARTVEIYLELERIAFHARNRTPGGRTTLEEHRSEHHRAYFEQCEKSMTERAGTIGLHAAKLVERLYATNAYPESARRSSWGIVSLSKKYGNQRTDMACRLVLRDGNIAYRAVKSILEHRYDLVVLEQENANIELPFHENVRGAHAYT